MISFLYFISKRIYYDFYCRKYTRYEIYNRNYLLIIFNIENTANITEPLKIIQMIAIYSYRIQISSWKEKKGDKPHPIQVYGC